MAYHVEIEGGVDQMVERLICIKKVTGSMLVFSIQTSDKLF
jgi:hypothetical protein